MNITIELMFAGVNMFLARLRLILARAASAFQLKKTTFCYQRNTTFSHMLQDFYSFLQQGSKLHLKLSWLSSVWSCLFILGLLCLTWCTQRMSALGQRRTGGMVTRHTVLPRGTVRRHRCRRGCREQTLPPRQCKWNCEIACGYSALTSGTHGTPRSNQRDSHSLRVSSAELHVTWRNTRHMEHRDDQGCF